ncbi:MAG: NmrA/HSCARG family protein, partial [Burkholderiales bacterium]|nr:NmrA/HSCARG family protein [Burkholderiales bacterium]
MSAKRVIAVVGATGAQGGGLARAILNDPASAYAVRALVRDPSSAKSQELARAGAELVKADIDDEAAL